MYGWGIIGIHNRYDCSKSSVCSVIKHCFGRLRGIAAALGIRMQLPTYLYGSLQAHALGKSDGFQQQVAEWSAFLRSDEPYPINAMVQGLPSLDGIFRFLEVRHSVRIWSEISHRLLSRLQIEEKVRIILLPRAEDEPITEYASHDAMVSGTCPSEKNVVCSIDSHGKSKQLSTK